MIIMAKEDVLKALKKFSRLAKQDVLASPLTSNPDFWSAQAESRRNTYKWLMGVVTEYGVDHAYQAALDKYADLPFLYANQDEPTAIGNKQGLELFFTVIGIDRNSYEHIPQNNSYGEEGDIAVNAKI